MVALNPSSSTQAVERTTSKKRGMVRNYLNDLILLGFGDPTNKENGIRISITEEIYDSLDVPDVEDDVKRTNIFKTSFETDNGFEGFSLYIMNRASPGKTRKLLKSLDLDIPGPKEARKEVKAEEDEYPDYD